MCYDIKIALNLTFRIIIKSTKLIVFLLRSNKNLSFLFMLF